MQIDTLFDSCRSAQMDAAAPQVSKDWTQGRTVYGGLSAGMVYAAIADKVQNAGLLRAIAVNFVGPLLAEQPFSIAVELLRQGKSTTQVSARVIQNDNIAIVCLATLGHPRQSKIQVSSAASHTMQVPMKGNFLPQIPKITPKFLKHFELAKVQGSFPFTGSRDHHIHGWMRFKQAPKEITDAHIITLIDAWPPATLQRLRWPAPASTMSWHIEFIHPAPVLAPQDWLAYQANTRQASGGYSHIEANVWDQRGNLLAISRQVVTVFDE